jgi:hypothetical protein
MWWEDRGQENPPALVVLGVDLKAAEYLQVMIFGVKWTERALREKHNVSFVTK